MILDDREFADLAAGNEIRVWMAISEALPPNVHVYWNTLLDEWRWFDEDSDGDVGGVLHPLYQDGQKIVVSSDIHGDMDAIVIRVIPEPRLFFYNTPLVDTPTAKARGILGLTTAFYANGLHSDARHFNRLLKRDFPCAPRYGVRSLHGLVFAAPDRDSDATGFTHPALRGWNPIPVLSRTSGIAVPNGHFTTPQPPTMLCAPSEHVGESMYPRAKAAGFYSSPTPPLFYKPYVWGVYLKKGWS